LECEVGIWEVNAGLGPEEVVEGFVEAEAFRLFNFKSWNKLMVGLMMRWTVLVMLDGMEYRFRTSFCGGKQLSLKFCFNSSLYLI